ncbi:SprT-like domain-containing protein [Thermodesulfobacteriota bacterium]
MPSLQLPLPFTLDESQLREYLFGRTGKALQLTLTDNAVSMVSVRQKRDGVAVRLHRMFLGADRAVLDEVADFIERGKGRHPNLSRFVNERRHLLPAPSQRQAALEPRGRFHNLQELFDSLNREYFDSRLATSITWGRRCRRYAVRKRTLGSYQEQSDTIRISPVLDSRRYPHFFLEFVVYHEMLHADMGISVKNGRRLIHTPAFKRREKEFRQYERAVRWEKKHFYT